MRTNMVDLLKRVVLVFKLRQSGHHFARYIGKVGNTGILLSREKNAQNFNPRITSWCSTRC